jgi:hypothetical protein
MPAFWSPSPPGTCNIINFLSRRVNAECYARLFIWDAVTFYPFSVHVPPVPSLRRNTLGLTTLMTTSPHAATATELVSMHPRSQHAPRRLTYCKSSKRRGPRRTEASFLSEFGSYIQILHPISLQAGGFVCPSAGGSSGGPSSSNEHGQGFHHNRRLLRDSN